MGKFVNPFTDIGFKIIFGSELSKDLLITFLNEMLKGEYEIVDFVYLDKEDHGSNVRDRGIVYDLYCRTSVGSHFPMYVFFCSRTCFGELTLLEVKKASTCMCLRRYLRELGQVSALTIASICLF